ncbi:hypothetical protein [Mesorhizobium sp.]|uniref:hypothetical protein n=1 Tax=Mesorhizobium sp. TaxID=1871066 RepID=UPI0025E048AE|nr:hypothetical protein [Mesorhizobium sp.]
MDRVVHVAAFNGPDLRATVGKRARMREVVPEDIQRARKLFAEGGFKALQENLGQGLLPAAAVGLFLSQRRPDDAKG